MFDFLNSFIFISFGYSIFWSSKILEASNEFNGSAMNQNSYNRLLKQTCACELLKPLLLKITSHKKCFKSSIRKSRKRWNSILKKKRKDLRCDSISFFSLSADLYKRCIYSYALNYAWRTLPLHFLCGSMWNNESLRELTGGNGNGWWIF